MSNGRFTRSDKIVCYQRSRTRMQRDEQLRGNRQFVKREGGNPANVIVIDDAGSSATFPRPGLLQLLDLIDGRQVTALVVADLSRLTRYAERWLALFKRLQRNKIRLCSVDGFDSFQKGAKLYFAIKTAIENALPKDAGAGT